MGSSSPRPERSRWARPGLRAGLVLGVGAVVWATALPNDLVWDDRLTLPPEGGVGAALAARTGPYYRPVVLLSLALDRAVYGDWAPGWHATNVALHLGVAGLLGVLGGALGLGAGPSLVAALVFLAHPVQTEAVTYVSGRTDVLCALFVLAALLGWRRARTAADRWAWAAGGALLLALLSKEAAVLIALVLLLPGAHPSSRPPRPLLPLAVAAAWLVATAAGAGTVRVDGLAARLPAIAGGALELARLLVVPVGLHLERFTPVPGWTPGGTAAAWLGLILLLAALAWCARRVAGGWLLLGLALAGYLPVSGVVPVYPAIADRALFTAEHFLYLPLLGLAPLGVGALARAWPARAAPAAPWLAGAVLLAWAALVADRNRDWRDEPTLFRHTLAWNPPAARVWYDLANHELAGGRPGEAERLYREALARQPDDAAARLNLGIALQRQGRRAEAEVEYRRALAADARLREAARALAALLAARGETRKAERVLRDAGSSR